MLEKPLDIFLKNQNIEFKFLLIWANENWTRKWNGLNNKILIKQEYKQNDPINFIHDIKKYLKDIRYIKINGKHVIGLYEPKKIPNLFETISIWRIETKKFEIDEIFILATLNDYKYEEFKNLRLFDGVYEFSPRDSFKYFIKNKPYLLYTATLYKDLDFLNITDDFPLFRGSMVEFDNSARIKNSPNIFENYSPEQFYMLNRKIIEWTRKQYNITNRFIFINAWNEWGEGSYLEPDKKYGYASINSLSKALFNQTYRKIDANFSFFNIKSNIAIQVDIYYEDLIKTIIDKINNIPVKFDLYITTNSLNKMNNIKDYVEKYSKSNEIEIKIINNIQRFDLPLLIQLKNKIKKYKYLCHICTEKIVSLNFDEEWRNYLLENILGNKIIISEILTDFENNERLGFIFPENYYKILLNLGKKLNKSNINYLLKKYFKKYKIKNILKFPNRNIFWARTNSIFQIFDENYKKKFIKELYKEDNCLYNSLGIILLYIVKLNGYYYKKIFKHF